jgi:molybdopterin synthase sulfur carrier subunit
MQVKVLFFAQLAEEQGRRELTLDLADGSTMVDAWRRATGNQPLPTSILSARNRIYADLGAPLLEGDEVAFFPPVTGG